MQTATKSGRRQRVIRDKAKAQPGEKLIRATMTIEAAGGKSDNKGTRFRGVAYGGGVLRLPNFPYGVVTDLAGMSIPDTIPLQADHSSSLTRRLGSIRATIVDNRVVVEGMVVRGTPEANRLADLLEAGQPVALSIGTLARELEMVRRQNATEVNGQTVSGPAEIARKSELVEISAVGIGADRGAHVIAASNGTGSGDDDAGDDDPVKAERERITQIRFAFQPLGRQGEAKAEELIQAGAPASDAYQHALVMMQASRPTAPRVGDRREPANDRVQAAAILLHAGYSDVAARAYDEATMTRAADLHARAGSFMGFVAETLRASGRPVSHSQDEMIRAAFSTNALAGPLSESMKTVALDTFRRAEEPWRQFAKRIPLPDFKTGRVARQAGKFQFQPVGATGELKHASLDGEFTNVKLGTTGRMIVIDRQAIINDDVGLLFQIPQELALESARVVGDDVADVLADAGGTFFTVGRGNYLSGSDSGLGVDGLAKAVKALRTQKDTSGRVLNMAPVFLIVPAALEMTARALVSSMEVGRTDGEPTGNPLRDLKLTVLVDARLDAAPKEWYLSAAAPNGAVVVATLNGGDAPVIEQKEAPFDVLGEGWRGYFDHGVAGHEYRAIIKSAGA